MPAVQPSQVGRSSGASTACAARWPSPTSPTSQASWPRPCCSTAKPSPTALRIARPRSLRSCIEPSLRLTELSVTTSLSWACSELAFVHIQTGDATQAHYWLTQADEQSGGEDHLLAVVNGLRGLAFDGAENGLSLASYDVSIAQANRAASCARSRAVASMAARTHLLRGDLASALDDVEESIDIAQSERWAALLPWPQSQRGEVLRRQGNLKEARAQLEAAYALALEVGDLCWASVASRSLAALADDRRDPDAANAWTERSLEHALRTCGFSPTLSKESATSRGRRTRRPADAPSTSSWRAQGRTGCAKYSVRAAVRLADLGDEAAGPAARTFGRSIDNPTLQRAVDSGVPI